MWILQWLKAICGIPGLLAESKMLKLKLTQANDDGLAVKQLLAEASVELEVFQSKQAELQAKIGQLQDENRLLKEMLHRLEPPEGLDQVEVAILMLTARSEEYLEIANMIAIARGSRETLKHRVAALEARGFLRKAKYSSAWMIAPGGLDYLHRHGHVK